MDFHKSKNLQNELIEREKMQDILDVTLDA